MKILLYTDCMSNNSQVEEEARYPALLKKAFSNADIKTIDLSGMTTLESVDNIDKVLDGGYDIIVYAFGVNDALPRGLKRSTRGAVIRWSYRIKLTKEMRLWYRKLFLNPLEYVMQIIGKPKHYLTVDETITNIDKCLRSFHDKGIDTVLINIAPVKNYRFINGNYYIKLYNEAINKYCVSNGISFVNAYDIFYSIGLDQALGKDKFHYSDKAHKAVAERLIEIINTTKGY